MFSKFLNILTIVTGQRSPVDGLFHITPEQKIVLNVFTAKSGSFSLKFCNISSNFLNISFLFDCFYTNKAGKPKDAESNQA